MYVFTGWAQSTEVTNKQSLILEKLDKLHSLYYTYPPYQVLPPPYYQPPLHNHLPPPPPLMDTESPASPPPPLPPPSPPTSQLPLITHSQNLLTLEDVLNKYPLVAGTQNMGKLAVLLAKECYFGKDVMAESTVLGMKTGTQPLPREGDCQNHIFIMFRAE